MSYIVIGNFGYKSNQLDGQTIKTRNVYSLMSKQLGDSLFYYDTSNFSWITFIKELFKHNTFYVLPAHNAIRIIIPLLYILSIFKPIKIIYIQIGGWLSTFLKKRFFLKYCLKHIDMLMIETRGQMKELDNYGFKNLRYVPNFRIVDRVHKSKNTPSNLFKLVFCARIQKEKGIEHIFKLADYILEHSKLKGNFLIDFYGMISQKDQEYFTTKVNQYDFVNYCGTLDPSLVSQTISKYDLLLLPTRYFTEGFPGSILDSYVAGIPVVVTHWKHAEEFVDNNQSGVIIPFNNFQKELNEVVFDLSTNINRLNKMKEFASKKGNEYCASSIITLFMDTF